ncbi:hypothetical protein MA16_Dca007770 [Dendrobium catenatum]|uniref:Uncharacterized protein n=1 Tax=Dendrobium catenatum TaxID=906689 RepID=A0A2I0X5D3_9ASPA|nr:hypothetical protein MA16_Dca007770 [Dendrobium catenatum]
MPDKTFEGVTNELKWRSVEDVKKSMVEEVVIQIEKGVEAIEFEKVQGHKTMVNSVMEINEANGMSIKSSNIISKNKFNILDRMVEAGEIVFFEVVDNNMVEEMNGLSKDTYVNFKSKLEELREVIDMKEGDSSNIKSKGSK